MSSSESTPRYALLACDVFEEELEKFGGDPPPWKSVSFLEMGLHDSPDNLRQQVQEQIGLIEQDPEISHIVLAYALCGNGLVGITAGRLPLVLPRAHDCISVLLGSVRKHLDINREKPGCYFYSPGWIRGRRVPGPDRDKHLREFYGERYGDDEEMIEELIEVDRDTFSHNSCVAYVDLTENATAEAYCRECARYLGWKFEKFQGEATLFKDMLSGNWDDERFLVVPPGSRIQVSFDDSIVKAEPADS